jgi:solute carrier family 15 (oligopeptide transporter), member 1
VATDTSTTAVASSQAKGHPIGFWFFFWGEFAERCSYYGMRAILALYMTQKLGVDKADAGTFMSFFIAACYFFPLLGGYLADNFFGKYWTIVGFSLPYVVAQFLVGIENQYVVFGALTLLAMGSGVIKPNISTLMGLTYDQQRPGQDQLRTSAFSWFYMAINIGAALSQFAMPWLRTKYGYQVAFLFPAGLMALALVIFALGKRFYAAEKIERKVIDDGEWKPPLEGKTLTGLPVHYKMVNPAELAADKALRLQTLLRIGSVFLLVMFFWAIFDQAASTWIFFADTYMETTLCGERADGTKMLLSGATTESVLGTRSFGLSADAIQGFNPIFIIILVPVSVWLFKTLDRKGYKVRATQKMIIGFVLTGLAMTIMSLSGFLAGKKLETMKLTTPEGELILPMPSGLKLDEVQVDSPDQPVTIGSAVRISASDWEYDKAKKKLQFVSGSIILGNGQTIAVAKGHIASNGPDDAALKAGGVLEPLLKSGDELAKVKGEDAKATVEIIDWVPPAERVTVWWQVLAYLILTVAEILISVTGLELAFVAAPPSMKSFVTGLWLATVGLANLVINAPITRLYPYMQPGVYYAMLGVAMGVVVVAFIPIAAKFNRGMVAPASDAQIKEGDTETV